MISHPAYFYATELEIDLTGKVLVIIKEFCLIPGIFESDIGFAELNGHSGTKGQAIEIIFLVLIERVTASQEICFIKSVFETGSVKVFREVI